MVIECQKKIGVLQTKAIDPKPLGAGFLRTDCSEMLVFKERKCKGNHKLMQYSLGTLELFG